MGKKERLDKVLSNLGYGSRKDIKAEVKRGKVKIDGKTEKDPGKKVDPYENKIEINGEMINYREFVYIMMNKPMGVISATEDRSLKTVVDLLSNDLRAFDPFPIGRLDKDTTGLLILSNDGKMAHELLAPKKHVDKVYYADVKGLVTAEDVIKFKEGVELEDGYKTMPAKLKILKADEVSQIEITIKEGKFHQIKRMFKAVGKEVVTLKRLKMGNLNLDNSLKEGEYREITEQEIRLLKGIDDEN